MSVVFAGFVFEEAPELYEREYACGDVWQMEVEVVEYEGIEHVGKQYDGIDFQQCVDDASCVPAFEFAVVGTVFLFDAP